MCANVHNVSELIEQSTVVRFTIDTEHTWVSGQSWSPQKALIFGQFALDSPTHKQPHTVTHMSTIPFSFISLITGLETHLPIKTCAIT